MSKREVFGYYSAATLFVFILTEMSPWFYFVSGPMGSLKLFFIWAQDIFSEDIDGDRTFSFGMIAYSLGSLGVWLLGYGLCVWRVKTEHPKYATGMIALFWMPVGFATAFFIGIASL